MTTQRVITYCNTCVLGPIQTDADQAPTDSETFAELVWNWFDEITPDGHVHELAQVAGE